MSLVNSIVLYVLHVDGFEDTSTQPTLVVTAHGHVTFSNLSVVDNPRTTLECEGHFI